MHAHHVEQLGSVQFANSCRAEAQEDFLRGLAFLHSFGYEESRRSFLAAAAGRPALRDRAVGHRHDLLPPDLGAADAR
jgi:hypothetical protein